MPENIAPTVTSLFCGLGGFDFGFQKEGFNIVWANDISLNATRTYSLNYSLKPICGDLINMSIDKIPQTDIIIGGPPCQAFSLVGKRRPDDERGKLVFRFLEIVQGKKPKSFVMENVPGLAASKLNGMRLTDCLVNEFNEVGYAINVINLNASHYLVPQKRKRIFILGTLMGKIIEPPTPREFAKVCYGIELDEYDLSAKAALDDLGPCVQKGQFATYSKPPHSVFSSIMRRNGKNKVSLHECPRMSSTDIELVKHIPPGGNYQNIPDEIAPGRVLKFKEKGGRTTTYGRLHPDKPAYTINTYFRRPNVGCNFHYSEPRLITPREAMRLQSIPDDFELVYNSQDERNSFIGNAVPPLLSHAIAWTIKKQLF